MLNLIMNHIKGRLGATHRKLELSDDDLVRLLRDETLNTLSVYFPYFIEYRIDMRNDRVENMSNTYHLPTEIGGFRLLGVEKVIPATGNNVSGNALAYTILGGDAMSAMSNFMNTKLSNGMSMAMLPPETFQFMPPNLVRLHNYYTQGSALCVLKTTHREDFTTFSPGLLESIKALALADVSNDLLGIRQYFSNVGTTFGEINLNLESLQQWSGRRDDLIESFRKNALKNSGIKKMYFA